MSDSPGKWRALPLSSRLLRCDMQILKSITWLLQDVPLTFISIDSGFTVCFLFGQRDLGGWDAVRR